MLTIHRVTVSLAATLLLSLSASIFADEMSYCGHEDHDSLQLREQAGTRTFWRDDHAANPQTWQRVKILGFNDFHGQLESRTLSGRPVGGAAVLAAYLQQEITAAGQKAIMVHAGDHVGASPPISALLQDEPSISFLNMLANKSCAEFVEEVQEHRHQWQSESRCNLVGTLGNHEFDEGVTEMQRLIHGGQHANGPFLEQPYRGARFPYINANVVDAQNGKPILPPYVILKVNGERVAFIGAVLKETPSIVTPTGVAGVKFLDEADAINSYIPAIKKQGVRAIVVTIHQGTAQSSYSGPTQDAPYVLNGAIGDIVKRLDDEVDIVVSGHSHSFTNALMPNQHGKLMLVTQAFSASTAYAAIDVAIDPRSHDIVEKSAVVQTTWADIAPGLTPNPQVQALVTKAATIVAPLVNRLIGEVTTAMARTESAAGESVLGNFIADAQRAAMHTDFAFMNPGGIRADLDAGPITWGELFTIQPFNNDLVKMELTGAQIMQLLNQQWAGQPFARILKTSGLVYTWDANRPVGDRIVAVQTTAGVPLDPAALYSVTVNSFMAAGGDNFTVLPQGINRVVGPVDLDALVSYVQGLSQPFSAPLQGRILRLN
jgi:5'-nucleotidase